MEWYTEVETKNQSNDNWKKNETKTEMGHKPNNTLMLKLEYDNWNETETKT